MVKGILPTSLIKFRQRTLSSVYGQNSDWWEKTHIIQAQELLLVNRSDGRQCRTKFSQPSKKY